MVPIFGLVAGVFTHDLTRSIRASRALRAGQVFVNEWYAGGVETPFGGLGLSGFGRGKRSGSIVQLREYQKRSDPSNRPG